MERCWESDSSPLPPPVPTATYSGPCNRNYTNAFQAGVNHKIPAVSLYHLKQRTSRNFFFFPAPYKRLQVFSDVYTPRRQISLVSMKSGGQAKATRPVPWLSPPPTLPTKGSCGFVVFQWRWEDMEYERCYVSIGERERYHPAWRETVWCHTEVFCPRSLCHMKTDGCTRPQARLRANVSLDVHKWPFPDSVSGPVKLGDLFIGGHFLLCRVT